jgi:hypothetical protein
MAEAGRIANTNSRAMLQRVTVITKIILAHVLAVEKRSLRYKNRTLARFLYRRKSQLSTLPLRPLRGDQGSCRRSLPLATIGPLLTIYPCHLMLGAAYGSAHPAQGTTSGAASSLRESQHGTMRGVAGVEFEKKSRRLFRSAA